jgi:NAD(P)-dependent dehydrogenase (short-subunit alcohol dehydrogenase family)
MNLSEDLRGKWALILGGSSGGGLSTARQCAEAGMNVAVVHRDHERSMEAVTAKFRPIVETGVRFLSFNCAALDQDDVGKVIGALEDAGASVHVLVHSLAFGTLDDFASGDEAFLDDVNFARTSGSAVTSMAAWARELMKAKLLNERSQLVSMTAQEGRDVRWVPTSQDLVDAMLDMAKVTPDDYLIDLGSGDGRLVITAAQRGLRAHGIEYNPDLVTRARAAARKAGVEEQATFEEADLFQSDLTKAQVITLFLLPSINERLRPTILDLEPGTRIVANSFRMGDWEPDQTQTLRGGDSQDWRTAHLWIVPAKVAGAWRAGTQTLTLKQTYQQLTGTLGDQPLADGKIDGERVSFTVGETRYTARVDGAQLEGEAASGATARPWRAQRAGAES